MNQKTILLVEDQPEDEELTVRALGRNSMNNKVIILRDGLQALDYFFGSGSDCMRREIPHLILLDLKLPKVDGLEVLRQLRAHSRTKFLPIVIVTASEEEDDLIQSYKLGADSVIRKPVNLTDFSRSVQQLGLYWLVSDELVSV